MAVGLRDLVEVLGAAHAAHVAELVGREQLEHQQVGVLLLDHAAALGHERAVDLRGRLHGGHRAHDLLAEGVEQVRDPHEPAAPALALEHVEHGLAAHAQARSEVRAHAVLGGRRAGEHRREADHRAGRIRGLDREVLRALAREPVHHGGMRLPEALAVAAVHDDHVDAPGECLLHRLARRPLRIARQPARERARGEGAQGCGDRHGRGHPQQRAGARFLGEERARAERYQELRQLLERVAARGIRVGEHEAPEPQPVRPGSTGAQVVVDRAPDHDREEQIAGERAREQRRRAPRLQQRQRCQRGEPEQRPAAKREGEARQHERGGTRAHERQSERPVGRQPERRGREQHQQRVHDREGPPLVEDVPGPRGPHLDRAGRPGAPLLDRAHALRFHLAHASYRIRVP